jgi:hypothetical protein
MQPPAGFNHFSIQYLPPSKKHSKCIQYFLKKYLAVLYLIDVSVQE